MRRTALFFAHLFPALFCVRLNATSTSGCRRGFRRPRSGQLVPQPPAAIGEHDSISHNLPDPTRYCQNIGVQQTVGALETWIHNLDINKHYPRLPEARNLAVLVPHNDCLKKLVELGANISQMESKPGVANLLVKTDFDQAISPKLWLLSDFGFELSQLARIVTVVPKTLINLPVDEVSSRLKYFTDRGFEPKDVVSMLCQQPQIMNLTSIEVDRQLGDIMKTFGFQAQNIIHIAIQAPKCIAQPLTVAKDVFVVLTKMIGFPLHTAREMVVNYPPLILSSNKVMSTNVFHLHRRLSVPFEIISQSPRALCAVPRILSDRTNFLVSCKLFQPDGSKPLYTPLDGIVQGTDDAFCDQFAKNNHHLFNKYLRTL